ncbi:MAG: SDR family oxidoreductase [Pseudomonadota bacterium]
MAIAGKSIIITGASSGIGAGTAKTLAEKGAKVMLAARRTERIEALCKEIGEPARFMATDVTKHGDMIALAEETIKCFGDIDVLINNAGVMPLSFFASRKVEEWTRMVDVNIKGVLYGIDAVLTHMLERGEGHIINVASVAGHVVRPSNGVYAGTKFAVRAISEGLRQETAGKVRVTVISPGAVTTELGASITDEKILKAGRSAFDFDFMEPADIANAIAFAIDAPPNVAVNEILVRPLAQPH